MPDRHRACYRSGMLKRILIAAVCACAMGAAACQRPPAPPPNAIRCGSDWDCPDGDSCVFPDVDTFAICVPGNDSRWDVFVAQHHAGARRPKAKP